MILDAIPAPIWFKDADGVYQGCNAAFERFIGRRRGEVVGREIADLFPPDLAEVYLRADDHLVRTGGTQVYEAKVPWADGSRRDCILTKSVFRDGAGAVAGLAGAGIDVTDQRRAERELRTRLAQQAAVARLGRLALEEADPQVLEEEAVRLAAEALAVEMGAVVELEEGSGAPPSLRLAAMFGAGVPAGPMRDFDRGLADQVLAGGGPVVVPDLAAEARFPPPGRLVEAGARSTLAVLIGSREAPLGVLSVHGRSARAFDADDLQFLESVAHVLAIALGRRRALEAKRRSDAGFRSLIEASPELVTIHRDGRVRYANPALLAAVGASLEEVVGTDVRTWIHPDDLAAYADRLAAHGRLAPQEVRLVSRDGRVVSAEFLSIGLELDGERCRVAIGRDLTERKQVRARLALSERLASIGTLAAGVAHELNNPLTFVLSNLGFVAEELRAWGGPDAPAALHDLVRALDEALQGAQRMRVIVRDLRTLSRSDESHGPVELRKPLEYAVNLASTAIRPRARIDWDVCDVPPVLGNEARLGQVFLNLLLNAAQAIPDGAPERHRVRIGTAVADGLVAVEIADTGAGITPEHRARIFDPFFTTKPPGVGTGLGLWVSHNIVAAHGGHIEVESAPGQGTCFRVLLPVSAEGFASPAPRSSTPADP